jgi:predicted nucleotidyltransferase component of viral defense system
MIDLRPEDILHKSHLNQLLIEIIDQPLLAQSLAFKGGSCASMLGYLDRFSVDLDFDIAPTADLNQLRVEFREIFNKLDLTILKEFDKVLFYQIRYRAEPGKRNTIKVSVNNIAIAANQYKVQYFPEIDRMMNSQTIETMFANKLVAVTDRYNVHKTIAGRDIYDIHYFLVHGYAYHGPVIQERTGLTPHDYLGRLIDFIKEHVTQTIINEDLNTLLPNKQFQQVRKILLPETLSLLANEQARVI